MIEFSQSDWAVSIVYHAFIGAVLALNCTLNYRMRRAEKRLRVLEEKEAINNRGLGFGGERLGK